ncbi:hypothetical protein COB64_02425 [Candidatus Wolfebacteria bacterium]|nr:MAG: hypothetical protein COB64_02425 [Candidatus Wolfebacteria bacterium]
MKNLKILEGISAISLLLSKALLAFEILLGWPFSIFGYVLVAVYNFLRRDTLLGSTVVGLAAMSSYGWYKWSNELSGLFQTDYFILSLTAIFALVIYVKEARKGGLMGHLQGLITISTLSAFILLGHHMFTLGWIALLTSHTMLAYFYNKKDAKYYVWLQIASIAIALTKIVNLLI